MRCGHLTFWITIALFWSFPSLDAQTGSTSDEAAHPVAADIDKALTALYPSDQPGAAALLSRHGEIILRRGYGLASLELSVPMRPEMSFCIASITKTITAVGTLRLVQEGQVDLEDEVNDYLPTLNCAADVQIGHLLSHTSGIPSFGSVENYMEDLIHTEVAPDDLIAVVSDLESLFAPGSQFRYSNPNYAILARITELVSESSWEDFLSERVFTPAAMTSTYYGRHRRVVPNAATPYAKTDAGWERSEFLSYTRGYGLGGLFSTVDDLHAFYRALRSGTLLDQDTLDVTFTRFELDDGSKGAYGLGFAISVNGGRKIVHHSGGIFGWTANMAFLPEEDIFAAVLTNHQAPGNDPRRAVKSMIDRLLDE